MAVGAGDDGLVDGGLCEGAAERGVEDACRGVDATEGTRLSTGDRFKAQTRVMAVRPVAKASRANQSLEKLFLVVRLRLALAGLAVVFFFLAVPFALAEVLRAGDFAAFFVVLPVIAKPCFPQSVPDV